ncbi:hypothetical protein RBSWK_00495 [Rhodopirellula baltica SWK14]|uniref:Uncharacterized protein n=1 Tax=Rhodopirellula baltica SWK14 TaxID=993516 RepID=L7CR91_RHOBT|nr:hypothetical protein RBSWK_00495 [Rhodopirellula baltica SWK14]
MAVLHGIAVQFVRGDAYRHLHSTRHSPNGHRSNRDGSVPGVHRSDGNAGSPSPGVPSVYQRSRSLGILRSRPRTPVESSRKWNFADAGFGRVCKSLSRKRTPRQSLVRDVGFAHVGRLLFDVDAKRLVGRHRRTGLDRNDLCPSPRSNRRTGRRGRIQRCDGDGIERSNHEHETRQGVECRGRRQKRRVATPAGFGGLRNVPRPTAGWPRVWQLLRCGGALSRDSAARCAFGKRPALHATQRLSVDVGGLGTLRLQHALVDADRIVLLGVAACFGETCRCDRFTDAGNSLGSYRRGSSPNHRHFDAGVAQRLRVQWNVP